jgi:diguanylate cyclase (GGDEF)-like protein
MLSLTRAMNRIENEERLYKTALGCYLAAISLMQECPLEAEPDVYREYKNTLREIQSDVSNTHEPEVLDRSCQTLTGVLRNYYGNAAAIASGKADDLRAVMSALGEAAQLLGEQQVGNAEKLREFTNHLQETGKVTDLGRMRRQIMSHVASLRAIGDASQRESIQTLSALQSQLVEFSNRLDNAEQRACLDALTGLLNRGEGELRLGRMIGAGRTACAIMVDLNRFKHINDSWGHSAGDQVLKTCARILADQIRAGDLACRWGGDEFLLILQCGETIAGERAKTLKEKLRVPQKIVMLGKIIEIATSASVGVTELREGETVEDFVARADAEMYRDKGGEDGTSARPMVARGMSPALHACSR